MFYDIRTLPDTPVIVGSWHDGFRYAEHGAAYTEEVHALFDGLEEPVFYVLDLSALQSVTMEGMMQAANAGARKLGNSLHHPMVRATFIVSDLPIIKMVAEGMRAEIYGDPNVQAVSSMREALASINNMAAI